MKKLDSEFIVKMHEVVMTKSNLYMFLEYCDSGDLKGYIKQQPGKKLAEQQAIKFLQDICRGFKSCRDNNVIHRDIKPANILLHQGRAKISDFGFARNLDYKDEQGKFTYVGTPLYMAPQLLAQEAYTSKCDVWSLGFMFYEMLYGTWPYMGQNSVTLYQNIKSTQLTFPQETQVSDLSKDFIKKCLQIEENQRITWEEIFMHPIINIS